jgi:hypothetical protein
MNGVLEQLPVEALETSMASFLEPIVRRVPNKRLKRAVGRAVGGVLGSESPIVTRMAQVVARTASGVWASSKQLYRFLKNERFTHQAIAEGLYEISYANVMRDRLDYWVVAIDPVNLEKPYTKKLEGVSTVYKSTPPRPQWQATLDERISLHYRHRCQSPHSSNNVCQLVLVYDRLHERECGNPARH